MNSGSTPGTHATAYGPYTPAGKPANITTGKLGYESTPFDYPFTNRSAAPAVVGPDGIYEFMRQIWTPEILEHKFQQNLLLSAFNAPVEDGWMNNLAVSHSARITFKKWMNPLQRVRVAEVKYKDGNYNGCYRISFPEIRISASNTLFVLISALRLASSPQVRLKATMLSLLRVQLIVVLSMLGTALQNRLSNLTLQSSSQAWLKRLVAIPTTSKLAKMLTSTRLHLTSSTTCAVRSVLASRVTS